MTVFRRVFVYYCNISEQILLVVLGHKSVETIGVDLGYRTYRDCGKRGWPFPIFPVHGYHCWIFLVPSPGGRSQYGRTVNTHTDRNSPNEPVTYKHIGTGSTINTFEQLNIRGVIKK